MPEYVTYYAVSEEITEILPTYFTWPVGECEDGTVYLCLDKTEDATDPVYNCSSCYDSLELLFKDYPEIRGTIDTGEVDEEDKPIVEFIISRMSVC